MFTRQSDIVTKSMKRKKLSALTVADQTGLSEHTIKVYMAGGRKVPHWNMAKFAKAIGVGKSRWAQAVADDFSDYYFSKVGKRN